MSKKFNVIVQMVAPQEFPQNIARVQTDEERTRILELLGSYKADVCCEDLEDGYHRYCYPDLFHVDGKILTRDNRILCTADQLHDALVLSCEQLSFPEKENGDKDEIFISFAG